MAHTAPQAGRVLNERYRLEEKLGEGGMGQIWRAEHLILKAPVAVKLVDRENIPDDETLSRFIREAQAAAAIRSPHVVQILDYGTDGKVPFMVMELLDGETLAQRIKTERRLGPQDTARIITHIGRAVGRAHEEGIVHRDLKPENVFLVRNDDDEIAKVLDFGVAKIESDSLNVGGTRTRTGSILGTPYYMSPEQAQGNKTVDFRSDLWSMAVIAFECLTGKRPFFSDGLGDLVLQICIRDIVVPSRVAAVPLGFDDWFRKGTEREPDRRFQSARELVDSLRDALGIEARETYVGPEVLVTSGSDPPPSREPTSRSEAVTELASASQFPRPLAAQSPNHGSSDEALAEPPREEAGELSAPRQGAVPAAYAAEPNPALSAVEDRDPLEEAAPASGREDGAPALTVQQFGTTTHSSVPPAQRSSSAGMLWGVAGVALGVGAIIGFFVVSRGESADVDFLPATRVTAATEVQSPPRRTDTPELSASGKLDPAEPASSASALPSSSAAPAADAGADETDAEGAELDAGVAEGEARDAGGDAWVKPDWARPDDEEELSPLPPASPATGAQANPY